MKILKDLPALVQALADIWRCEVSTLPAIKRLLSLALVA